MPSKIKRIPKQILSGLIIVALLAVGFPQLAFAVPDPALTGSTTATGFSGAAMPVDLQVSGTGNPTVPVKLRVSSGSLAMSTTTGLTFTGSSTGSTLQFSGTLTNVNAAMATLSYTRSGTGSDTLEASLVNPGEVFFPGNNHLYEYVSYTSNWNNAKTNAESRTKYGATGYLTTVTSQAENDFVAARLLNAGWMGASDSASEGDWKWVVGPESGTSFWSGTGSGSTVGGRYANWGSGEPNNAGDEDCAQFLTGGSGQWNDLPCASSTLPGYVVEYGSSGSPIDVSSLNVAITTQAANNYPSVPSSLGPSAQVSGAWDQENNPTLSFSLSDSDNADTLQYRLQIDDSANFASPVVDYTSALAAQGSRSFSVGQAAGSGSYTVGSSGQSLSDGQYYWRVKAIDNKSAESAYATARSGSIAFGVDTTNPTLSVISLTSDDNDTTPTLSWTASSDSSSGLHASQPYTLYWSQSSSFTASSTTTVNGTTYTMPTNSALADGTWYFRVRAHDTAGNSRLSASINTTIDTTMPTTPGTPIAQTSKKVSKPTWTWAASTDDGVGLASPAYVVEWSESADFSTTTYASTSNTNSYTHSTSLPDGKWYFRVSAADTNGNSVYSSVASLVIDTTVPTAAKTTRSTPSNVESTVQTEAVTVAPTQSEGKDSQSGVRIPLVRVLVTDKNGRPIAGAKVTLHSEPRVAYSDKNGFATFRDVEAGEHHVVVSYLGTTSAAKPLTVASDSTDVTTNVQLQKVAITSGEGLWASPLMWLLIAGLLLGYIWLAAYRRRRRTDDNANA